MSKVIYMVSTGQYSDFRVRGLYTSKLRAERVAKMFRAIDSYAGAEVWEEELDPPVADTVEWSHTCTLDRDGNVLRESYTNTRRPVALFWRGQPNSYSEAERGPRWYGRGKSREHARRAAEQLRRDTLASGRPLYDDGGTG